MTVATSSLTDLTNSLKALNAQLSDLRGIAQDREPLMRIEAVGSVNLDPLMRVEANRSINAEAAKVGLNILASRGVKVPMNADGSVSITRLEAEMNAVKIDKTRQTAVKISLLHGGYNLQP